MLDPSCGDLVRLSDRGAPARAVGRWLVAIESLDSAPITRGSSVPRATRPAPLGPLGRAALFFEGGRCREGALRAARTSALAVEVIKAIPAEATATASSDSTTMICGRLPLAR